MYSVTLHFSHSMSFNVGTPFSMLNSGVDPGDVSLTTGAIRSLSGIGQSFVARVHVSGD